MGIKHSCPVPPFMRYCSAIIPTMFDDSLSYYEALCALNRFIQTNLVEVINNNATVTQEYIRLTNELKEFVENYFENLDVQEEINNKLDAMVEDGTLQEIIGDYLNASAIWGFDNVADMKASTNLIAGSFARTLGYYTKNDGGGAFYKIEEKTETPDDMLHISLDDNSLMATYIYFDTINVKQLGAKGDGINDDVTAIQTAINALSAGEVFIPDGKYMCSTSITCKNDVHITGDFGYNYINSVDKGICFNNTNGFTNSYRNRFTNLIIQNLVGSPSNISGIATDGGIITQCTISGFEKGVDCAYHSVTVEKCNFHDNKFGIFNPNDARIMNCTFNANTNHAINMQSGASDNIIIGNKIEWNGGAGVNCNHADNNVISNNILDRNSSQGISCSTCANIVISDNMLRRNGVTSTGSDNAQIRISECTKITISNNTVTKGNSEDDGTGTVVPRYGLTIKNSSYVLSIGNNYCESGTEANPVNTISNSNTQLFDLGFSISPFLTGALSSGEIASSGTLTLNVAGTKAGTNEVPALQKVNYQIRRTDKGAFEAGELVLSNFRLWGSASSNAAKTSVDSFLNGNITLTVTYDVDNNYYVLVFSNTDASHNFNINLTPIDI